MDNERKVWSAFLLLALAWGTSFFFIKIALETLDPFTLVSMRLLIGWVGLMVIMKLTDQSLPRSKAIWGHLTFLGVINTALPFILITWAESGIDGVDSTVASVLNSTVPLFSIVIAGALLRMEQLSVGGVSGVIVGFLGVVLMLSRGLGDSSGSLMAHLAIIFAALCYAVSSIYARKNLQQVSPVVLATGQLLVAGIVVSILAVALEDFNQQSFTQTTIMSLLWLGLLGSCLAYILYFFVLRNWGPTRTTLVTYLLPVVGVTAGVLILDEAIDWRLVTGGLLILSGVALVNWRPRQRRIEAT
jgi:drug/metabolite transporter (DMT)-like permease